jgi:hypothetical protein
VRIATVQYLAGRRICCGFRTCRRTSSATEGDLDQTACAPQQVNRITLLLALGGSFEAAPAAPVDFF